MTYFLRATLLLLALAAGACAGGKPQVISPDDFAVSYAEALRRAAPEADIRIAGPLELSVERDGESVTVFLDNAYTSYRADPGQLQAIIDDYVSGLLDTGRGEAGLVDASRIVPVIKGPAFLDGLAQSQGGDRTTVELPVFERYNDDLIILYAEDAPRSLRYLYEEHLVQAEVSRDVRLGLAVDNLRALLPDLGTYENQRIHGIVADGIYESSLLLFDELWGDTGWTRRTLGLSGEPVVAVPTRNLLLVVDSDDPASVALLREITVSMFVQEPYPVAGRLFVYRNGRFEVFDG